MNWGPPRAVHYVLLPWLNPSAWDIKSFISNLQNKVYQQTLLYNMNKLKKDEPKGN